MKANERAPGSGDDQLLPKGRGHYELLGEIARGGMGIILKGHDRDLGREVAVKVLDEKLIANPAVLHRFIEEAQIGGQLQHPGVVPVYELGTMDDQRPWFAMKLIQGRTLAELLAAREGLDDDRRRYLAIFESVCQTVAYAHSKGVIHRDLKPANVMIGAFGEVQVVDWGLAKVLSAADGPVVAPAERDDLRAIETVRSGPDSTGTASIVGSVLGTPAYMAPEQARGELEAVDERADVFSLGAILCEILTGAPPYESRGGAPTLVLAAQARLDPAHDRIDACAADAELKELCRTCLAPTPAARPPDAGEVALHVQEYLASLEEKAHKAELAATEARELRRRQRLFLALAATVVAAVITVGFVLRTLAQQRAASELEQLATARRQLDDAAARSSSLQDAGRHEEALELLRAARLAVVTGGLDDPPMIERADRLVGAADQRAQEFRRNEDIQRRNDALLARCEDLGAKQIDTLLTFGAANPAAELEATYVEVFQDYGIDITGEDLLAALDTLIEKGIGHEVALALDDWAGLRRQVFGPRSFEVEAVTALAFDLDPDPDRTRLREALLADDEEALLAFARETDLSQLEPGTIWSLSQGLTSSGNEEEAFAVVLAGATRHPDDFLLNIRAGSMYAARGSHARATHYFSAALGVRPTSAAVNACLGTSLRDLGSLPTAAALFQEALRLNPALADARNSLAWTKIVLGDYAGAAQSYRSLVERFPEEGLYEYRLLLARFMAGDAARADVLERLASDATITGRNQGAAVWTLTFHPDPAQRDPAKAIEIQDSWGHEEPETEGTEAAALLELGRPLEALATLDHGEELGDRRTLLRAEYAVYRARAYYDLGNLETAKRYLEVARQTMREILHDGPEPWAGSPLVRLYRETIELVGD